MIILKFCVFLLLFGCSVEGFNQLYGKVDDFAADVDTVPFTPLKTLSGVVALGTTDLTTPLTIHQKMDYYAVNNVLVFTVSGYPTDKPFDNARIELKMKAGTDNPGNDQFGFFWNEDFVYNWNTKVYSVTPTVKYNIKPFVSSYSKDDKAFISWRIGDNVVGAGKLKDKIRDQGYFHFAVGDDTIVDYFRFVNEENIVSFTCNNYTTSNTFSSGVEVHSSSTPGTEKVNTFNDASSTYPFINSVIITTPNADKTKQSSVFKFKIETKTRFFLFRRTADSPKPSDATTDWVVAGGWTLVTGSNVTLKNSAGAIADSIHAVYTKVYDGPAWVVFGPPAHSSNPTPGMMYFASYMPLSTLTTPTPNFAAACDCSSTGDPHYISFDNGRFDLYRSGTHHFVKSRDCQFDVQTYMYSYVYNNNNVSVNGIVSVRYQDQVVTLARQKQAAGVSWSGDPTVYLNEVTKTSNFTATGISVTKSTKTPPAWNVTLTNVGLSLIAQSSGDWYTITAHLSSKDYLQTVDGLCGNCDGQIQYTGPDCVDAVPNPSSRLTNNQVWSWGSSWSVKPGELAADWSKLGVAGVGSTAFSTCKSGLLRATCVFPPTDNTPGSGVEPVPPGDFVGCSGNTPITPPPSPPVEPPPDVPDIPLCEDTRADYADIVQTCINCATSSHYPTDFCITDICLSGKPPSSYICQEPTCLPAPQPTYIITKTDYIYSSLDNVNYDLTSTTDTDCPPRFSLPAGWEVAPVTDEAKAVAKSKYWNTRCMTTVDGASWETLEVPTADSGTCARSGNLIKGSDGCYISKNCDSRILIRKAKTPVCGNGIKETGEDCDDGNTVGLDGCGSTCKSEWDHFCMTDVTPNLCSPINNVVSEHDCDLDGCVGCEVTEENKDYDTCCECSPPCC